MEALLDAKCITVGPARAVNPGLVIDAAGIDDKRVVVFPFAYRVSEPLRRGIFGEVASVSPNDSPDAPVFIKNHNAGGRLQNLCGPQFVEIFPRNSLRIAGDHGVVGVSWQDAAHPVAGLGEIQRGQSCGGVGRPVLRFAILGHGRRSQGLDASAAWIPDAEDIVFRGRAGRSRRRGRNLTGPTIRSTDVASSGCVRSGLVLLSIYEG